MVCEGWTAAVRLRRRSTRLIARPPASSRSCPRCRSGRPVHRDPATGIVLAEAQVTIPRRR
ncbi:hypothetical protein FNV65_07625 [Streptomyces sp. S1A1-8]|nr:hypothetical protein FNV67_08475 [Streptomyces sp. S1D4-20]QDN65532.1 hypothetical protein FNV66_08070 [Streptomyces sp. S1D4-14]QDN96174.1 hypothetical protein FNV58_09180 [Streptomyces sp. RLB1-9]QDO17880.1 hypothetical protein FNV65_07625 [Streptomyces sp. S1A1-8]QDO28007.1 hypothetical protein FNV63_07640 [Streptomyces sp. S1A1-3]QDO47940.1 hypothetical protein FNV60_06310 [Streptomyces sp. RLB3-5]QDO58179.1 hypothetical protein FNV59_08550 [Streptomyces sp. RLB1-8]